MLNAITPRFSAMDILMGTHNGSGENYAVVRITDGETPERQLNKGYLNGYDKPMLQSTRLSRLIKDLKSAVKPSKDEVKAALTTMIKRINPQNIGVYRKKLSGEDLMVLKHHFDKEAILDSIRKGSVAFSPEEAGGWPWDENTLALIRSPLAG